MRPLIMYAQYSWAFDAVNKPLGAGLSLSCHTKVPPKHQDVVYDPMATFSRLAHPFSSVTPRAPVLPPQAPSPVQEVSQSLTTAP